jgi:hypothetical protein
MRNLLPAVLALPLISAWAATLDVPPLPAASFADGEVSYDAALPAGQASGDGFRTFRLTMEFDATPSNNVQTALGRDAAPADGRLGAGESDLIAGWDCGSWFLLPRGLKSRHEIPGAPGRRTLTLSVRVDAQGVPRSAEFRDCGGALAFSGLSLSPVPGWLDPGLWTRLRVTARGSDAAREAVSVRFLPDGARIVIK